MGFALVPTLEKRPVMALSADGRRRPETQDPRVWLEWTALWPDLEIGLVPGSRFGIIDVDQRDTAGLLKGLESTFTEASDRDDVHRHALVAIPEGSRARAQARLAGVGDWKAQGQYCRMPLTPGYEVVDVAAPILQVPPNSPLWSLIAEQRTARSTAHNSAIAQPNAVHRAKAKKVVQALLSAPDAKMVADVRRLIKMVADVRRLMKGDTSGHPSPSEADYSLALMATFHTDEPSVVLAVLQESDLQRPKWTDHPSYLDVTITKAIARRKELESAARAKTVSYAQGLFASGEVPTARNGILRCLAAFDRIENDEGFVRVPVDGLAIVCRVHRNTVRNHLRSMVQEGIIETTVLRERSKGRWVCTRWVRRADGTKNDREPRYPTTVPDADLEGSFVCRAGDA